MDKLEKIRKIVHEVLALDTPSSEDMECALFEIQTIVDLDMLEHADGMFIDGQLKDPKACPTSVDGKCTCGEELQSEYGFASGYGLGAYNLCYKCGKTYDFMEDKE